MTLAFKRTEHKKGKVSYTCDNDYLLLYGTRWSKNSRALAYNAIANMLFVKGWCLINTLIDIVTMFGVGKQHIAVIFKNNEKGNKECIGVATVVDGDIQIFIAKGHRGKKAGETLIKFLKYKRANIDTAFLGIKGSDIFYNKQGIANVIDLNSY